jgi:pimeloyl-ACP methyl ester carboxylesterase
VNNFKNQEQAFNEQEKRMEANLASSALYLHGGPGFGAEAERRWFANMLPIDWWDQPLASEGDPNPYRSLVKAAEQRLNELHASSGRPVAIVAHSFGAVIASELARRRADQISTLTLLTPIFDPAVDLMNLAESLVRMGQGTQALAQYVHPQRTPLKSLEDVTSFAGALLQVPNLLDHYWAPASQEARRRFNTLLPEGPPFDFNTFVRVLWDECQRREPINAIRNVSVTAILGRHDRQRGPDAKENICQRFPKAQVKWAECGHLPLFELPPQAWTPW